MTPVVQVPLAGVEKIHAAILQASELMDDSDSTDRYLTYNYWAGYLQAMQDARRWLSA